MPNCLEGNVGDRETAGLEVCFQSDFSQLVSQIRSKEAVSVARKDDSRGRLVSEDSRLTTGDCLVRSKRLHRVHARRAACRPECRNHRRRHKRTDDGDEACRILGADIEEHAAHQRRHDERGENSNHHTAACQRQRLADDGRDRVGRVTSVDRQRDKSALTVERQVLDACRSLDSG
jgi:hypothetical protein